MNKYFYVSLGLGIAWLLAGNNQAVTAIVVLGQVIVAYHLANGKSI